MPGFAFPHAGRLDITSPRWRTVRVRFLHEIDQSRSGHRYYAPLRLHVSPSRVTSLFGLSLPGTLVLPSFAHAAGGSDLPRAWAIEFAGRPFRR
jgi:hypothetical protein